MEPLGGYAGGKYDEAQGAALIVGYMLLTGKTSSFLPLHGFSRSTEGT